MATPTHAYTGRAHSPLAHVPWPYGSHAHTLDSVYIRYDRPCTNGLLNKAKAGYTERQQGAANRSTGKRKTGELRYMKDSLYER
jgi:hypothetical protein